MVLAEVAVRMGRTDAARLQAAAARKLGNAHLYRIFPKLGITLRTALRDALEGD